MVSLPPDVQIGRILRAQADVVVTAIKVCRMARQNPLVLVAEVPAHLLKELKEKVQAAEACVKANGPPTLKETAETPEAPEEGPEP